MTPEYTISANFESQQGKSLRSRFAPDVVQFCALHNVSDLQDALPLMIAEENEKAEIARTQIEQQYHLERADALNQWQQTLLSEETLLCSKADIHGRITSVVSLDNKGYIRADESKTEKYSLN